MSGYLTRDRIAILAGLAAPWRWRRRSCRSG